MHQIKLHYVYLEHAHLSHYKQALCQQSSFSSAKYVRLKNGHLIIDTRTFQVFVNE